MMALHAGLGKGLPAVIAYTDSILSVAFSYYCRNMMRSVVTGDSDTINHHTYEDLMELARISSSPVES
ncbi:unnamed protein product [Sphagnum tenellum]